MRVQACESGYVAAFEAAKVLHKAGLRQQRCPHGFYLWVGLLTCADHRAEGGAS